MKKWLIWMALALAPAAVPAQSVHPPINQPVFRAFDSNGKPLAGGMLYSYAAGTSTPLATYADAGAVTPNTNPVILDSAGQAKIFLGASSYKFVLQDANGVQQWSVDNISGSPTVGGVASVFGRTGAVTAVTGDYTCSQVTGAVCSTPTIYYQNIMAGGTVVSPQRNTVNLISGSGISVTCADNSTTNNTDCTFAVAGGTVVPRTCNAYGCYQVDSDGTITEWGTSTTAASGGDSASVAVTFPFPFTTTANLVVTTTPSNCVTGGCSGAFPGSTNLVGGSLTTSGFTVYFASSVPVGGGGGGTIGSVAAYWMAKGN